MTSQLTEAAPKISQEIVTSEPQGVGGNPKDQNLEGLSEDGGKIGKMVKAVGM